MNEAMTTGRPSLNRSDCLICGETNRPELTLEHIIPQTLWRRFGVDPNQEGDVRKTHTTLCKRCNDATSRLHSRTEMMELIEKGTPATDMAIGQMADWVFWILLLLALERGDSIVPADVARRLLHSRFVTHTATGIPPGWRVYAARVATLEHQGTAVQESYEVLTAFGNMGVTSAAGHAIGFTGRSGAAVQSALTIGIGSMGFLVLPPTESSGPNHLDRVDAAAAENGLERLVPRRGAVATLTVGAADVGALRDIFVSPFEGSDRSLLPQRLRSLLGAFTDSSV
ncbi:hypothetical protein P0L94_07110 [Microbacter sp. GSS18]|nr:hypothetical protein P0L94_07110 [Microbacter sp. GSS18]